MKKNTLIIIAGVIIVAIITAVCIRYFTKNKETPQDIQPIVVTDETPSETPTEEIQMEYTDSQGHIRDAKGSAILPQSKIETGEIDKPLYAQSDNEFYGQSGKYVSDTLTDKDMRKKLKTKAVAYLRELGINEDVNFYMSDRFPDGMYLLELINGDGYFWYFEDTDVFETVDDFYDTMIYKGKVTVEEDKILHDCIWYFMPEGELYFTGIVTKNPDGTFTIKDCKTKTEKTYTLEELKVNAEYGPQFED